ncbi:hypothetical protein E0I26_00570 [Flavobacterium rhamnosiphilum]|uniref:Gliding motility-associated C-terminal domain-containing protein n=1 Tax=Flavobacterium rhamnosiphilum TaxID=2541724 RepID=A0A4R5FBZ5_9FLAO|nr:gliding motility-associated C-terminal domain-containing protein [Flavobacterium rhamnosiphilum]TDE46611.1 hypothetical protein E0I26_00570 [Flavobacterium rhamnosiphilum]
MKDRVFIVKYILFSWLILSSTASLFAQTITPKKLSFSQICAGGPHPTNAGQVFNEYQAAFTISNFPAGTTFVVELSDPSGSFTTPIATTTLPSLAGTLLDTAMDKTITFAVPTNLVGSNTYQLRVKPSTGLPSPSFTCATNTKSFPAYYKAFDGSFYINKKASTIGLCSGGSISLSIDNPTPNIQNSSPVNYPSLRYKWYKDGGVIGGETGTSLSVNTAGTYYVEMDYGVCTDPNSRSQSVIVSIASGAVATITSSLGNPFCSGGASTTLSTPTGNSYVWKKDNVAILGANTNTYQTNQAGLYTVAVDFGGCSSTATVDLKTYEITSSINVPSTSTMQEGESKTVIATTNATNPAYQWYLNETAIPNAIGSTYDVTTEGDYKVIITQTSACSISNEIPFVIKYPFVDPNIVAIPNLISPNGDGINDTWIIPQDYVSGTNTKVLLISSLGEIVLDTNDYQNNWPENGNDFKNINPVYYYIITTQDQKVNKGSITVIK